VDKGDTSVKNWSYADNPLKPEAVRMGANVVRIFNLGECAGTPTR
jgi:hypothetical protein